MISFVSLMGWLNWLENVLPPAQSGVCHNGGIFNIGLRELSGCDKTIFHFKR